MVSKKASSILQSDFQLCNIHETGFTGRLRYLLSVQNFLEMCTSTINVFQVKLDSHWTMERHILMVLMVDSTAVCSVFSNNVRMKWSLLGISSIMWLRQKGFFCSQVKYRDIVLFTGQYYGLNRGTFISRTFEGKCQQKSRI